MDETEELIKGYHMAKIINMRLGLMFNPKIKSKFRRLLNYVYRTCFMLGIGIAILVYSYNIVAIPSGMLDLKIEVATNVSLMIGGLGVILIYYIYRKNLKYAISMIGSSFFSYDEDTFDEIIKKKDKELKFIIPNFTILVCTSTSVGYIFPTLFKLLFFSWDFEEGGPNMLLSLPVILPFKSNPTEHPVGFIFAYLFSASTGVIILTFALGADIGFVTISMHYRAQFQILNKSVGDIEKRALKLHKKLKMYSTVSIWEDPNYHKCLNLCLKENVKHHQILIDFFYNTKYMFGSMLTVIIGSASLFISLGGYLLVTTSSVITIIKYNIILCAFLVHIFFFCWYGQEISNESRKTVETLCQIPWYNCDKQFRQVLKIMLIVATRPVTYKSVSLNQTASLETFATVVNTSYSYFNVLKQFH